MAEKNQKPISETEARKQMKTRFKRWKFKKSHLDVCSVCLKLNNLLERIKKKGNKKVIEKLEAKGNNIHCLLILK
jgi:hypothetical protein